MFIVFNIIVIAVTLLITYWWANQGLFSALLHLVCVIVAGAIALAFWEPLAMVMLRGGGFDDYAWGTSLLLIFVVALVILRLIADRTVRANLDFPHWANLTFGGVAGGAAAILTVGISLIGVGLIPAPRNFMGYTGYARGGDGQVALQTNLWLPAHLWTQEFYSFLSVGSMYPLVSGAPLRQYAPDLYAQSSSLLRDSHKGGFGRLSMLPEDIEVLDVSRFDTENRVTVLVRIGASSFDFGERLTLSTSQVRLIGAVRGSGKPSVAHPDQWSQAVNTQGQVGTYKFDDPNVEATSVAGREEATFLFEFPIGNGRNQLAPGETPRFLQIRNTRVRLPDAEDASVGRLVGMRSTLNQNARPTVQFDPTKPLIPDDDFEVTREIRRLSVGINALAGTSLKAEKFNDQYFFTEGTDIIPQSGDRPGRNLRIVGIYEPEGTRIIQLDVSRGTVGDVHQDIRQRTGEDVPVLLVDGTGASYTPIGYIHRIGRTGQVEISLDPQNRIGTIGQLPPQPSGGENELKLIYRVPQGVQIVAYRFGDETVANADLQVPGL